MMMWLQRIIVMMFVAIVGCFVGCSTDKTVNIGTNSAGIPVVEVLKLEDERRCENCSIKFMDSDYNASATYYITPSGFELDKLDVKGYRMQITVSYTVYYKKNMLIDIGYLGSPKYELTILNSDGLGKQQTDLTTSKTEQTRSLTVTSAMADLKDQRLTLTFSTDNIQNVIYFKNIVVTYQCIK